MRVPISRIDGSPDILTPGSAPKRGDGSGTRPRQGWEDAFRRMAARGDDKLLDGNRLDHAYDDDGTGN